MDLSTAPSASDEKGGHTVARYTAQVGADNAAGIGEYEGYGHAFRDLGGGVLEIVDLDAARELGPDSDGSITEADGEYPIQVWIGGVGYEVHELLAKADEIRAGRVAVERAHVDCWDEDH